MSHITKHSFSTTSSEPKVTSAQQPDQPTAPFPLQSCFCHQRCPLRSHRSISTSHTGADQEETPLCVHQGSAIKSALQCLSAHSVFTLVASIYFFKLIPFKSGLLKITLPLDKEPIIFCPREPVLPPWEVVPAGGDLWLLFPLQASH